MGDGPHYGDLFNAWATQPVDQMAQSLDSLSQFVEFETVVLSSYAPRRFAGISA